MRTRRGALAVALAALLATTCGSAEASTRTRYVVGLGDSVVSASACGCTGFVERYASGLQGDGRTTVALNLGVPGSTSADLLHALLHRGRTRDAVRSSSVVVLMSGANDVSAALADYRSGRCSSGSDCFDDVLEQVQTNLARSVRAVRALRGGAWTRILLLDYWNVTVDGAVARQRWGADYRAETDRVTRATNDAICTAARVTHVQCVDTYAPFKGRDGRKDPTPLLAADGDHPSAAGHQVIARALLEASS
ncbi:lysophospholipase L1-like esterase [Motilibacter rhizosphaerae]|uniref:Lysophospholipase L1-like esterase n=1 Tax=Motilibacter rhizosphaerae TaxID=598652 RepID=A0A4Q7NT83_9ACTN|nr:SGNH/GDSL hydrolase family protein [Motilibacter rhizosphaerae]RZS90275.1 lysophospholipase L1-like esterase [Motilibacter rhizosphaerae]